MTVMTTKKPQLTYLKDYRPSAFLIDEAVLIIDLYETHALLNTTLTIRRNPEATQSSNDLVLDGECIQLKQVQLDGVLLSAAQYQVTPTQLIVHNVPNSFTVQTLVESKPHENTRLSGLYKSGSNFCTQCESQGFRRITYFLDRPDVLTHFTVTISADATNYPVLLSNGNRIAAGNDADGRHWVT